ncbi:MAG: sulfotransferase [Deltaproteobacteria bacterium]|nr:sulfotransferase [Deltaproteobacteria bacterium]
MILSTKSAGSTALQELICVHGGGRHVAHTRHQEHETLFFTKAASVLGRPQLRLPDSEVPIPAPRALAELRALISENAPGFVLPAEPEALVYEGFRALAGAHAPLFVEKSPHHLHQRACLELLLEARRRLPELDIAVVGLVRNPMDALYSAWSRWRTPPESLEDHWRIAHENLEWLGGQLPADRLRVVRYEDLAKDPSRAPDLLRFLGVAEPPEAASSHFRESSVKRWRTDPGFGFVLDPRVARVAQRFGYSAEELRGTRRLSWPVRRVALRAARMARTRAARAVRRALAGG